MLPPSMYWSISAWAPLGPPGVGFVAEAGHVGGLRVSLRELVVGLVIVVHRQAELLQVVRTRRAPGCFTCRLNRRQQ